MKTISNVNEVKRHNLSSVRKAIKSIGAGTKNTIAKMTGLSTATCNTLLNEMAASGEIVETEMDAPAIGRPPKSYRYNADFAYVLCVFVNRENGLSLNAAAVDPFGKILWDDTQECDELNTEILLDFIDGELEKSAGIRCISLGFPGYYSCGVLRSTGGLTALEGTDVVSAVQERFRLPVKFENNTNAMAHGVYTYGDMSIAGRDLALVAFYKSGHLGCGIVSSGEVLEGSTGFAGEVSHLYFGPDAPTEQQRIEDRAVTIIAALSCIVNPDVIFFTGDAVDKNTLRAISDRISEYIPEEHRAGLFCGNDIRKYYFWGLAAGALEELLFH